MVRRSSAGDFACDPSMELFMLPNPLHPAIVHFPVVLAFLLPIFAIAALWTIRRGARPLRAWSVPLAAAAALMLSAWLAVETGESQEERVEQVVADQPLDTHEEAAETFMLATAMVLVVSVAGLAPGVAGKSARVLGTVGAVALVGLGAWVGHSGGQLVYQHGAASAYTGGARTDRVTENRAGSIESRPASRDDDDR
jgi:uncharacterized membrane protein